MFDVSVNTNRTWEIVNFIIISPANLSLTFLVFGNLKALPPTGADCGVVLWLLFSDTVTGVAGGMGVDGAVKLLLSSADDGGSAVLLVPLALLFMRLRLLEGVCIFFFFLQQQKQFCSTHKQNCNISSIYRMDVIYYYRNIQWQDIILTLSL